MKKYIAYIVILAGAVAFVACDKEKDRVLYNGPDLVEFYPVSKTVTTAATPKADSIKFQLVGPQRSTPINVTFEIDPSSDAVATTDYTITTPTVTIPANSSVGWIKFSFNKVSTTKTLKVVLTGGDEIEASENFKTFTYTLK